MGCHRSEFKEYLDKHFGILLPKTLWIEERGSKVYIYNSGLKEISTNRLARKGLLAGKLKSLYGVKPSLDFVLTFGYLATRNYIQLSDEQILECYRGNTLQLECDCEDGLVIGKDSKGRGVAIFLKVKNKLKPLIPKNRLLRP